MPGKKIPKRLQLDKRAAQLLQAPEAAGADDDLLNTKQIAYWFGVAEGTLELARFKGFGGPPFIRIFNRIRYPRGDARAWLRWRKEQDIEWQQAQQARLNGATTPEANQEVEAQLGHNGGPPLDVLEAFEALALEEPAPAAPAQRAEDREIKRQRDFRGPTASGFTRRAP